MKKSFVFLLSLSLTLFLIVSCTIEKRHYMPGYHVNRVGQKSNDKNTKQEKTTTFKSNTNISESFIEDINEPLLLVSDKESSIIGIDKADNTIAPLFTMNKIQEEPRQQANDCDEIILRNGNEISVMITEIGTNEVKYRMCDNLNGPIFTKNKSEIFMIKYANGTSTVFNEEQPTNTNITNHTHNYIAPAPAVDTSNDKDFTIAVVLWLFLGAIGIHRFYLGHIGVGVLYLLTAGLCGIGWLIDGIMLFTGGLQPKHGKLVK